MARPPHRFTKKICHWYYCARCGLVALKNQATEDAIRKGCDPEED